MPLRFWLHLAEVTFILALTTALYVSWREGRIEHDHLTAAVAEAKQSLAAADARQHDRDSQLAQTLAGLAALKSQIQTPAQIVKDLPNQIPLPAPLQLQPVTQAAKQPVPGSVATSSSPTNPLARSSNVPDAPAPAQSQTLIPNQDLKPLYDFALDCKSCQAKLTAVQGDLTDERAKTSALSKERDAALKAAQGGGTWKRLARAAKWFALGAAAGALAAKTAH